MSTAEIAAGTAATPSASARARRAFYLRKLHSLSGAVPLGAFLIEHLWTNAAAIAGEAPYAAAVARLHALPALGALEVLFVFAPLAFHAIYGVVLSFAAKPNAVAYGYSRNWLYVAQRATGLAAFVFVVVHLAEYRVRTWLFGLSDDALYAELAARLSSGSLVLGVLVPWWALAYVVGIGCTVFHFANGVWGFCASWGITLTRAAQRRTAIACAALGALLFVLGTASVVSLATGAHVTRAAPPGVCR